MRVIGYAYEAALHCPACAHLRFGDRLQCDATDREGNPVHPVFGIGEHSSTGEYCDDCFEEIYPPFRDDDC